MLFVSKLAIPVYNLLSAGYAQLYAFLEPYGPEDLFPMFLGLIMMFFGGHFMTIIACVEAYRVCGWESTYAALLVLWEDYKRVAAAQELDDQIDDDGDGVADVAQIESDELLRRKMAVFMRSTEPQKVSMALGALYAGSMAVLATLRLQMARFISLGVAMGHVLNKTALRVLQEPLKSIVEPDYQRWVPVIISYVTNIIGISIAWTLQRVLATVHSALRGAQIFTDAFARYTKKRGHEELSEGYYDEVFAGVCCLVGIYWQLNSGFSLPFIFQLLLSPFIVVETTISYFVAFS